ncbi:MAG: rod shape-determining protein [Parcubacteria group bacterium CG_4_9_14_0_2_um_filter_35_11]|nr:MAG: rod shape-determining protein [Parcubacteria group bacterium CG_4_9_14_0_2_um_filter_35_11]
MIWSRDMGVDLGTVNTLVYVKGRGIIIHEPSVVAVNKKTGQILAIGEEARKMVGKTPAHIVAIRPLVAGVISDFEITEQMLRYFIDKAFGKRFFPWPQPRLVVGVPCGVTEVEKKAVEDAARNAGAGEAYLIEEPLAAAIGIRLPIQEAGGNMIVDIGGGTTEVAVISLGGIVNSRSIRIAGERLNQDIVRYAEEEFKLVLGERTAEEIKIKIGSAMPLREELQYPMRGRDIITGLPKEIMVTDEDVREAMKNSIRAIVSEIKNAVEDTPPELLADVMKRGIYLVGGGSLLRKLDELIQKETRISVKTPEDPMTAVVRGCGIVLENLPKLREVLISTEELEPPK